MCSRNQQYTFIRILQFPIKHIMIIYRGGGINGVKDGNKTDRSNITERDDDSSHQAIKLTQSKS